MMKQTAYGDLKMKKRVKKMVEQSTEVFMITIWTVCIGGLLVYTGVCVVINFVKSIMHRRKA